MRIGFIGAGRVGFTMGKYLKDHSVDVIGYYSRTPEHAKEAAEFTDTQYYDNAADLIKESDAVILTVSDTAIRTVFEELTQISDLQDKIVCHTSGATSSRVFDDTPIQVFGYSIHPIYAVSDRYESYKSFSNAFITIEGHERYLGELVSLFESTELKVGTIDTDTKYKYHAASVVASNLVCGLYGLGIRLMTECGFNQEQAEDALRGLFRDNAIGAAEKGPVVQLTGPLERNDVSTVRAHLAALDESQIPLYIEASKEALILAKAKNETRDYSEMERLLKGGESYEEY